MNPFQVLDKGNPDSFEEDLKTTVEHLIKNPNDDFVSLAKETGRDAFEASSIPERKIKLNQLVSSQKLLCICFACNLIWFCINLYLCDFD